MPLTGSPIYLSTMLLEKNRANGKGPSLLVSDWMEPIAEDGFAGVEIWINHLHLASRSEWELIRDKAAEIDFTVALISATLPCDASDKSHKLRETLLEACDYFHPDGLKFTLAEDRRLRAGQADEAVDFARNWLLDMPKEIAFLYGCREGEGGLDGLARIREAFPGPRHRATLNPFHLSSADFAAALATHGEYIGNLGVQVKRDGKWSLLSDSKDEVQAIVAVSRSGGYKGTWSVEFTQGAGLPKESIEDMFDNSEKDLNFLTEALTRLAGGKV